MGSIAIIGAGNVGQAIAGHMSLQGHDVRLFDRWGHDLEPIRANGGGIDVVGEVDGHGKPSVLTTDLKEAVDGAQVVAVAAPAFAHAYISQELAAVLEPSQLVLFQPGVLGSGVELARMFAVAGRTRCLVAETATSLYTCRLREPANVYIGAVKRSVPLAAVPSADTPQALAILRAFFGERYVPGGDTLTVGLLNCNPIYHVPPAVLNFKTVEDADRHPLHSLVTPRIAEVVDALDRERLRLAAALGAETTSFWDFLTTAYGVTEGSFVERIVQGYGQQAFPEPDSVGHRYFTEDIPFGLVIWSSLAERVGLSLPLTDSFIAVSSALCGRDFTAEGRTAESLGLLRADAAGVRAAFIDGTVG
ncbi:NAD(P)-binding domain-containing protein [Streptomyces sp. HNM0575]|uniref:NAD/NADP octopine/nopaline dehydrogenase family protein n=1 Tax=Streptomyces sp. HNM0575 TaxID=2716338 RepID=UPI00145E1FFB|nr:NAD/NADP octopine/nopaline dehydrogenase family protein [Streptomyces sp. HNM0575]NLU73178.1 NAD(P)-binding domain-containing protein [Streptomyces sp. HNM0575]